MTPGICCLHSIYHSHFVQRNQPPTLGNKLIRGMEGGVRSCGIKHNVQRGSESQRFGPLALDLRCIWVFIPALQKEKWKEQEERNLWQLWCFIITSTMQRDELISKILNFIFFFLTAYHWVVFCFQLFSSCTLTTNILFINKVKLLSSSPDWI